jgi:D-alanyl-D-alanine carboxypeptidase/D-alanyl-D-alanine-endopeptidase (penicillin-binding protein 4)
MRYWQPIFVISCVIACATGSTSVRANTAQDFDAKITAMINNNLPDATVGVILQDVATGKIIFDYHGSKHFLPASTTKLFTAAAALQELGPEFRYETGLYYNTSGIKDGTYKGNVALKFSGDPSLKLGHLHSLLKKLQEAQIKTITGDLLIDDTIFDGPMLGQGWTWDSTPWYHAAPVSAIIIDRNLFGLTLFPSTVIGGEVGAKLENVYPGAKFRTLHSNVKAVTFEDSETICQIFVEVDNSNNVDVSGCWPVGTEPAHLRLAVKNPRLQAQRLINEALEKLQIKLQGKIKFTKAPDNLTKAAHHESEPLHVLLNAVLGDSNNLYAESLTKTLGAELYGKGSFKTGALAMQKILAQSTGIDFSQTRLLDGSGESRYNLLTPLHLARLLYTMHNEKVLGPYFRDALALSGVNGTLQRRFASFDTKANIQAKTGSLNGVSALAGYLTTRGKRELIITIMINHAMENSAGLKRFENELCYFLVNQV